MACKASKFKKNISKFLSFSKFTKRKIFDYKEIFFSFYVAKSIGFEVFQPNWYLWLLLKFLT